jgi:preprotein translocase subunit SecA
MVCKIRGQYPRDNQIIAVLQFLEGKNMLLQAGTGQGKSLIVAMIAILQKKLKVPFKQYDSRPMAVHIITVTDDLVTDGLMSNKKLFDACGVRARKINEPGNVDDIVYGTPFEFEAEALNETSDPYVPRQLLSNSVRRTVILDESDSHLIDNASGRVLTSDIDPSKNIVIEVLKAIADNTILFYDLYIDKYPINYGYSVVSDAINELIKEKYPDFMNRWESEKNEWIKNAFNIYNPNSNYRDGVNFILKKSLFNEIEDLKKDNPRMNIVSLINAIDYFFNNMSNPQALISLKNIIKGWSVKESDLSPDSKSRYYRIIELINQIQNKNANQAYGILFVGEIQYLDIGTGQIINNMKFSNGIQEFLEYKYFKTIFTEPTISVRSYSLYRYIRESELIFGLSGTVGLDNETLKFQQKVWRINKQPVILPEFAIPQNVEIKPSINVSTIDKWRQEIYNEINIRNKEQPILIITENPDRARDVYNYLKTKSLNPSIYEASSDKHILEEKLGPYRIIITTNLGGRGSDYQYDEIKSPKGLHVIIGFDSDEERILAQAKGRAGRAGNPGSWKKISFGPILRQKPDLNDIKQNVINTIGEDIIFEIYRFIKKLIEDLNSNQLNIINSRLTFLMSWLSKPDVRELLLKYLTDNYNNTIQGNLISGYILTKWSSAENPRNNYIFDDNNTYTVELSKYIIPHLKELNRIRN